LIDYLLPLLFIFVAFIYSSVGLGGGSSYIAIMSIIAVPYQLIPTTSLTLNLVVTSIGIINFWRKGHARVKLIFPFLITSIPMAYFAGTLQLDESIFQFLLLITLIFVLIRIYVINSLSFSRELTPYLKWVFIFGLGAILGFIAGAVGIGGGIYLVPLVVMFGLGTIKEAAAAGAMFVWVNSLAGVIARYNSGTFDVRFISPLIIAVVIGGFAGSYFGSTKFKPQSIQKIMGAIIIVAVILLMRKMI